MLFDYFRVNSGQEPKSKPSAQQEARNERLKTIVGEINGQLERHPNNLKDEMVKILEGLASNL